MLDATLAANEAQIVRAEQMIRASGKSEIGFVGVSFKPGTDDLRESPLAELAARLIDAGSNVRIYDPYVKTAFDNNIGFSGRGNDVVPDLASRMAGSIEELIDGSEVILIGNRYAEAEAPLKVALQQRPMIDLSRLDRSVVSHGTYQGICW